MHEVVARIAHVVAIAVELAAIAIVAIGSLDALVHLASAAFRGAAEAGKHMARLRLGRWLALALELELAADVVLTAVAPSWSAIGKLGAIAALRTVLNYFLQREMERETSAGVATDHVAPRIPERA